MIHGLKKNLAENYIHDGDRCRLHLGFGNYSIQFGQKAKFVGFCIV